MLIRAIVALLFGAIGVFSFAPFGFSLCAYLSFGGLVWLMAQHQIKHRSWLAFVWGWGYFAAGIHWVYVSIQQYGQLPVVLAIAILSLLISYLALYPLLFAFLLNWLTRPSSFVQLVIAAPALWQLTEFLRGSILSGFSWLQLGNSQLDTPLAAYLPIFGVNWLNLWVPILSGSVVYVMINWRALTWRHWSLSVIVIGAFALTTGLLRQINWTTPDRSRTASFALVQGNVEQSLKWNRDRLEKTLADYQRLTEKHLATTDIIIWPEAAITDTELNQQAYLRQLDDKVRQANSSLAVGIIDAYQSVEAFTIYNVLLVLGEPKPYYYRASNRYLKHHLVPFGEYVPLSHLLMPIARLLNIPMSSMSRGERIQAPLTLHGYTFTTAICYEIILNSLVWDNFTAETDFLLTVSNDAWFGDSIGPWQHLQMAQVRAAEFGRPLLRSTNSGITVAIDHRGKIIQQLPQFTQDVLTLSLSPTIGTTPFTKLGNTPYWLLTAILLCVSGYYRKTNVA